MERIELIFKGEIEGNDKLVFVSIEHGELFNWFRYQGKTIEERDAWDKVPREVNF